MASTCTVIGVSSLFPSTTTNSCRRATTTTHSSPAIPYPSSSSAPFLSERPPHFNSLIAKTQLSFKHSLIINNSSSSFSPPSAIASPNSILSEEAFKGLDGFSDFEADVDAGSADVDYASSETEPSSNTSEDELDVSKLGLPHRLVQTLQNRGITHLFPIQVCTSLFSFYLVLVCYCYFYPLVFIITIIIFVTFHYIALHIS